MKETTNLKEKVEGTLLQDSSLADCAIEVVNNNGVITLSGEVTSQELSDSAEAIARHTDGVITVINEIVVNSSAVRTTRMRSTIMPPK